MVTDFISALAHMQFTPNIPATNNLHARTSTSMSTPGYNGSLDLNRSVKGEEETSLNLNKTYPRPSLCDIEPPSFDLGIDQTPAQEPKKGISYIHFHSFLIYIS